LVDYLLVQWSPISKKRAPPHQINDVPSPKGKEPTPQRGPRRKTIQEYIGEVFLWGYGKGKGASLNSHEEPLGKSHQGHRNDLHRGGGCINRLRVKTPRKKFGKEIKKTEIKGMGGMDKGWTCHYPRKEKKEKG